MALNWIDVNDFSFNSMLLLERFQIRLLYSQQQQPDWRRAMALALRHNPAVLWYLEHRCPECAADLCAMAEEAQHGTDAAAVRQAEVYVLGSVEDFVLYTRPEIMDESSNYIYGWNARRLYEMADFAGKVVLDVGAGSGRLTFAAARCASWVYACEPVGTLREYLRNKIAREGISNVRVADGMVHSLPYPDSTFDIVMSGHVVGDDYDTEVAELTRVVKPGGWLLDCPGEDDRKFESNGVLASMGWEQMHYTSVFGGDVYRHRKQILK